MQCSSSIAHCRCSRRLSRVSMSERAPMQRVVTLCACPTAGNSVRLLGGSSGQLATDDRCQCRTQSFHQEPKHRFADLTQPRPPPCMNLQRLCRRSSQHCAGRDVELRATVEHVTVEPSSSPLSAGLCPGAWTRFCVAQSLPSTLKHGHVPNQATPTLHYVGQAAVRCRSMILCLR